MLGTTALDPVRGMLVDTETTAHNLDYRDADDVEHVRMYELVKP